MPAEKIQADYDALNQIATQIGQVAEATQESVRKLEKAVHAFQQGNWIGHSADKFYGEFDSAVLPSLKRLLGALENASQTTKRIGKIMREAEERAAGLLGAGGDGASSSAGVAETGGAQGANGAPVQQTGAQGASGTPAQPTQAQATETRLNENGITIHSSGDCRDRNNARCTSVDGMRQETLDGVIAFRNAVGVDLVMTGGTEVGHSTGPFSHANGYKVDVSLNPTVNRYIEDNFEHTGQRSDGAELYRDPNGNVYALEDDHWDITFH